MYRCTLAAGYTHIAHLAILAREGSLVAAWNLPWPVYVAATWYFFNRAIRRTQSRLLAAVDATRGSRALEPRIIAGANTLKIVVSIPMVGWCNLISVESRVKGAWFQRLKLKYD